MADSFSIAAGVIAVMQISQSLGLFVYSLTERPELCRKLASELACIHGLMVQLHRLEQFLQSQPKWQSKASLLQSLVDSLQMTLDQLDARLKRVSVPQAEALAVWPVHERAIKGLLGAIERDRSSILLQLSLIQADLSQIVSEKVQDIEYHLQKLNSNVSESLTKIDSLASDERAHHQQEAIRLDTQEREATIAWLTNVSFVSEHNVLCHNWVAGTTTWFFERPAFTDWAKCTTSEVLLVLGNAGCGKSMIASRLVEHVKALSPQGALQPLAFVYCSSKQPNKQDARTLVSSLLQQLCQISPVLNESVVQLRDQYRRLSNAEPSLYEVAKVLRSVIKSFTRPCFLVVDGLDECDDGGNLAEVLERLTRSRTALVRIAVFSRHACPVWPSYFESALKIHIDAEANRSDIELFAHTQLQRLAKDKKALRDVDLRSDVVQTLLEKADGMFLWVHLQAENLRSHTTTKSLRKALKQLPRGMEQVFERSLQRIRAQEQDSLQCAVRTLNWTLHARRPLQIREMLEAIAVEEDLSHISGDDLVAETELIAYCADLVVLTPKERVVMLLHSSLRTVLLESMPEDKIEVLPLTQHPDRDLAQVCVSYLLLENFAETWSSAHGSIADMVMQHPFLGYAAHYWAWHAGRATGDKGSLHDQILLLLSDRSRMNLILDVSMSVSDGLTSTKKDWPHDRNALHFIAGNGLIELCAKLEPDELRRLSSGTDSYGYTPLDLTLWDGQQAMCLKLLELESWLSKPIPHIHRLHVAIENGWADVVRKMLSLRARLDMRDDRGLTPLQIACVHAHDSEIVQILLNAGADIDELSGDRNTCLTLAAELGKVEIVDFLLQQGANLAIQTDYGQTALHMASSNGHLAVVKRLLEADHSGTLVHISDKYRETPLFDAVLNGHIEIVKLLLSHGAQCQLSNIAGIRPLHVAAAYQQIDCFFLLLQEKAGLHDVDSSWCSPLNIFKIMCSDVSNEVLQSLPDDLAGQFTKALNSTDSEWTAHSLENTGFPEIVHLDSGSKQRSSGYMRVEYPLHTVAALGSEHALLEALDKYDEAIWQRDAWGRTPYDLAIGQHGLAKRSMICRRKPRPLNSTSTHPELVNLSNQSYLQKPGVNFCLFLVCEVCNQHIVACHWLHCKLCSKLGEGWDICEHCFRKRRNDTSLCSSQHSREDLQLLFIANHMISGPMVAVEDL